MKKNPAYEGVLDLSSISDEVIDEYLSRVEIHDVWVIGHQYTKFLQSRGIETARDLKYSNPTFIRKQLTVVGADSVRASRHSV